MPMIPISSDVMCCTDCGGFHFRAASDGTVTHPVHEIYCTFDPIAGRHYPCHNGGKQFAFPPQRPIRAIPLEDAQKTGNPSYTKKVWERFNSLPTEEQDAILAKWDAAYVAACINGDK
jgi:hypothetical protein